MINISPKNKKSLQKQTVFGRSSVLRSGIPQLKPKILQGNTEALHKLLMHTPTKEYTHAHAYTQASYAHIDINRKKL